MVPRAVWRDLAVVAVLAASVGSADAQVARASLATQNASLEGATTAATGRAVEARVMAAVVVSVSTDALAVVSVLEPADFNPIETVAYTVTPVYSGAIVGRLSGTIAPGSSQRSVVLALRAPRRLAAGQVTIATIRFTAGNTVVDVPIIADVSVREGMTLSLPNRLVAARAGSPVRIPWRVTNTGNAPDTVRVAALLPAGWLQLDGATTVVLAPQQGFDGASVLLPPPQAQGLTTIRLIGESRGQPVAESSVDVQVAGEWTASGTPGPELRLGVAASAGPWSGTTTMQSLELQGPISDGLTLRARAATSPGQDAATYALSRAGMAVMPFAFQLASADWRIDGGTLGASVSDLAGTSLVGRGANLAMRQPGWNASAMAMSPHMDVLSVSGSMAASRFEVTRGTWSVSSALSRLRETRGSTTRALDAITLGSSVSDLLGGRFAAEIARREHDGGTGAGWAATWLRRTHDETFDLRYAHAPGGSRAFARAAEELSANASRRISDRLHVSGGFWRSADQGATLSDLHMSGWSFGANIDVAEDLTLTVGGRESGFDASTDLGLFGSGERGVDVTADWRRGWWSSQVTASVANMARTTTLADTNGTVIRQSAPRAGARGLITLGSTRGNSLSWTGHYERVGPGVGAAPEQWSYGVRLTSRPSIGWRRTARLEMSAERVGGALDAARSLMLHAALELPLPFEASMVLSAERNPYVVPSAGGSDWIYVVGLTRAVSLPRIVGRGTRGVVYRDINGNGRRESGEPGFAGVVLRRGASVAVTDRAGSFLLSGDESAPYQVDVRSLPIGWLTPSTTMPASRRQIGAVAVSPLEVVLQVDAADSARVTPQRLADVVVTARDSVGREWASRRIANDRVVFDAVPAGTYTVIVDASGSGEPLRASGELRATVTAGRATTLLRIVMRPRQLRFSKPGRQP